MNGERAQHDAVVMTMRADDDLTMFVYSAEPGSPDQEALDFLASWAAVAGPTEPTGSLDVSRDARSAEG